jgi:4-amino-4-deoxychorismate lyase
MSGQVLVNGEPGEHVLAADRGFNYGDGVFETMLVANGTVVWWDAHLARLQRACDSLGIVCPDPQQLRDEGFALATGAGRAALKLVVTRGVSGRGYAADAIASPTRVLSLHPAPTIRSRDLLDGIWIRRCSTMLASQPRLAGLKHLNRLEQVLARAEWSDDAIAEGIMCDVQGRPVCATAANLFAAHGQRLSTPALDHCGVAGITRAWVMAQAAVEVRVLDWAELMSADELFLSSSLRGILPVARLDGRQRSAGPMTRELQTKLWAQVPALAPDGGCA